MLKMILTANREQPYFVILTFTALFTVATLIVQQNRLYYRANELLDISKSYHKFHKQFRKTQHESSEPTDTKLTSEAIPESSQTMALAPTTSKLPNAETQGQDHWLVQRQRVYQPDPQITTEELTTNKPQKPTCNIPELNPFDPSIMDIYESTNFFDLTCNQVQPNLTHVDSDGYIHLNNTAVQELQQKYPWQRLECLVTTLDRFPGVNDDQIGYGQPQNLTEPVAFTDHDAAEISCTIGEKLVYYNLHLHPKTLMKKILETDEDHLSVFIFFQDSASAGVFYRYLPRTTKVLEEEMGMRVLHGHTKVGDNSRSNMVPVLTGLRATAEEAGMPSEVPEPLPSGNIDTWPIIWTNYSGKGYATAFMEESPHGGIFNYLLDGFAESPVDHYLRPYFLQLELTPHPNQSQFCYYNVPAYQPSIDYLLRLLRKYNGKRLFLNAEYTTMTHDDEQGVNRVDYMFVDFFETLVRENLLNHTVLLVMGDHGPRYSATRRTLVGLLEERMPIHGWVFPKWFLKKYPHIDAAVKINQDRLTSHFDTYQTFVDILESNFHSKEQLPYGTRGLSLLREIPANRTCAEAGIPTQFCVCSRSQLLNTTDTLVEGAARTILTEINNRIANAGFSAQCTELTLGTVERAELLEQNNYVRNGLQLQEEIAKFETDGERPYYSQNVDEDKVQNIRLSAVASPSGGVFEATVFVSGTASDKAKFWIPGDISRTNKYGNQSACITDFVIRKYCFCKNAIPNQFPN